MGIDESAFAHIMGVLTDLYSDPELAVIREYSTNALDAHVQAGVKRPIEITLPSALSPFLRIRDFGIGLDADDIRNIYSRYGTSTKRDSNDVVGMLGLGCKSALTYSDQFTVTGYKNGVAVQVSVSRDEDGAGSMTLVAEHPSDEHGVEVVIPAKRHHGFEAKAHHFFSFWEPGKVLINGEPPTRVGGDGAVWLDDTMLCLPQSDLDQDYIVMGNVPYPWPDPDVDPNTPHYARNRRQYKKVAWLPIGAVQFTPSRESLQMTKLTKQALVEAQADFTAKLDAALTAQIQGAKTALEAVETLTKVKAMGLSPTATPTWQGHEVVEAFTRDRASFAADEKNGYLIAYPTSQYGYRGRKKGGEWYSDVNLLHTSSNVYNAPKTIEGSLWFEGFDGAELTITRRNKLDVWCRNEGITLPPRVVLCKTFTPTEKFWLGKSARNFTEVDSIKLPKEDRKNEDGRPKGSYKGRMPGEQSFTGTVLAENIDTSKPIFWLHGNHYAGSGDFAVRSGILPADAYILCLDGNRIEKFKRDFPTAENLRDAAVRVCKAWVDKLPDEQRKAAALQMNGHEATRMKNLDEAEVNDPALKEIIRLATVNADKTIAGYKMRERWLVARDPKMIEPIAKYPLLQHNGSSFNAATIRDHLYLYLNAAYAAQ